MPGRQQLPAGWVSSDSNNHDSSNDNSTPASRQRSTESSQVSHQRVQFDPDAERPSHHHHDSETSHLNPYAAPNTEGSHGLRHRRSSMAVRLEALRQAGGVNSIDNFARSWQRAAGFYEITPVRPSFRLADDDEIPSSGYDEEDGGDMDNTPKGHRSMLRHALRRESQTPGGDDEAIDDDVSIAPTMATENDPLMRSTHTQDENIFTIEPSLQSPFGGSYGSTWGSLSARVNESSMRHAGRLFRQQQQRTVNAAIAGVTAAQEDDKANAPLLVRQIEEEDGKVVNVVVGQSTLPQTVCNSVNTLIGVGILALPLAMNYSGWVLGLLFFVFAALTTCYTAKLLAKCADVDGSLITFADLAFVSFGPWARVGVSILFILELLGACVCVGGSVCGFFERALASSRTQP